MNPSCDIIEFYEVLEARLQPVRLAQEASLDAALWSTDVNWRASQDAYLLGITRAILSHSLTILAPLRFGETPERNKAAAESLEALQYIHPKVARIMKNPSEHFPEQVLFNLRDLILTPYD